MTPPTPHRVMLPRAVFMSSCAKEVCEEAKGWTGRCPDQQRHPSRCSRLCWPGPVRVHTHGDWGQGMEPRGAATACFTWVFLECRLWLCPASCQVAAALDEEATVWRPLLLRGFSWPWPLPPRSSMRPEPLWLPRAAWGLARPATPPARGGGC